MIRLAPNVYVLKYLMHTNQLSGANEENGYRFIQSGTLYNMAFGLEFVFPFSQAQALQNEFSHVGNSFNFIFVLSKVVSSWSSWCSSSWLFFWE